jgi:predicted enzyme related to lactoylglutathione lyase
MKIKLTSIYVDDQDKALRFYTTDDVKGDCERIKARGAQFTMPPTDVTASTIAMLDDTCGNLIQLTQLARQ